MLNLITNYINITNVTFLVLFLILGYIWINRSIFTHAIIITFLSPIFNTALKVTFKVPLLPPLDTSWFAFPSGHMQLATVTYGYICCKTKNTLIRVVFFILLIGIGFSLVHQGYHNYFDTLGGVFFAIILIIMYDFTLKHYSSHILKLAFLFSSLTLAYVYIIFDKIPNHTILFYLILLGFLIGTKNFQNYFVNSTIAKIYITIFSLSLMLMIGNVFKSHANINYYIVPFKALSLGFIMPFSYFLAYLIFKTPNKARNQSFTYS